MVHSHHQQLIKTWFDLNEVKTKQFEIGDLVLNWDKVHEDKGKHTKFQNLLLGPFQIIKKIGPSTFILQDLQGKKETFPVNGLVLEKYFS